MKGATMRQILSVLVIAVSLGFLTSCAKKDTTGPQATVTMRDGTVFAGTVTKSSPSEITLAMDDKSTRTFEMKDVRSVEYGELPAAPATQAEGSAPPAQQGEGRRAAAPARRERAQSATPPRYHPPEQTVPTRTYVLPVGTEVAVRADETIDSAKGVEGQTYAAEVYRDVSDANGEVVIPHGSNAQVVIRSASKGGRFMGQSDLVLDLQSVSIDGRQYQLSTADMQQTGRAGLGKNKRTAEFVGGGAALGAIIGAIAGQGKGAAIGAASGAAAGVATQTLTKGKAIRVPAETVLTFKLDQSLHVTASRQ